MDPADSPATRWYLVHSRPRQEAVAAEQLVRQGYAVYLPRLQVRRRRQGRSQDFAEPLFPRYLFVGLTDAGQSLAPVRSTRGVANLVRFGIDYAAVPPGFVDELRSQASDDGVHRLRPARTLEPGEAVRVAGGVFAGLRGILDKPQGRDRVRVLLEVLGQVSALDLPADQVVPV